MQKPEFRHSLAVYLTLTFSLTWGFWITGFIINGLSDIFRIIGSLMPSATAILLTNICEGRKNLQRLMRRLLIWKAPPVCYAFVILFTLSSLYLPMWACRMLGANYFVTVNSQIGGLPLHTPLLALLCFFAVVLFGGPVGEELGWRGFVLPHLRKKVRPLISGIIVGIIWSLWHLPMFWFHVSGYEINFMGYLLETIYLSILFTWLYERSGGSLFLVILFHSVDNFVMALCWNDFMNEWSLYTLLLWYFRLVVLSFLIIDLKKRQINIL
ncbi:hypothetical protein OBV_02070 [Oscillibacter valericigenes Sjm18-20]|nr:hypothetical protein OBV_02070 [Oscillibacter valericigenes Sjm18-20]